MKREETELLKKEISGQMPAGFRTGAISENEDGNCSFGLFYDPHGDVCTSVCIVSISSRTHWDILTYFAWKMCSIRLTS
jgi:hypothetical protein